MYVAGAVVGSLTFGYLTDRLGRKRLFFVTLAVYTIATAATAFAWDFWSFAAFRFLTGAGIGGEYAAINSAIDELIPARVRGWVDLAINGSYWLGTIVGACAALLVLDTSLIPAEYGWRVAFGVGAVLGLLILVTRRLLPESPRWLMIHGREEEAEKIVRQIETQVEREAGETLEEPEDTIKISTAQGHRLRRDRAHDGEGLPAAVGARLLADGRAGVLLQRGLLHLRDHPERVHGRRPGSGAPLPDPLRARELPRPAPARSALRRGGQAHDDRRELHRLGHRAWP